MAAYATLDELKARLDFDLEASEESAADSALEDLSEDARYYGRDWPVNACPPIIKRLVLKAAIRYVRNFDGNTVSRAGDETVQWNEQRSGEAGSAYFLEQEKKDIHEIAYGKRGSVMTAGVYAWGSKASARTTEGYVPTSSGSMFPFFSSDTSPW